jgi:predicted nucleic acid-binding protein
MNVFIDTNVLMDVLLERRPFVGDSRKVWFLAERAKIRGLVSVLSYPNIYYIVRKVRDADAAMAMMTMLRDTFTPVPLDEQILNQAMDAGLSDFEDAIQYYSALRADAECLLTRNADDFPSSKDLSVLSPAEFLAAHTFK